MQPWLKTTGSKRWAARFALPPADLLREATYRRLWTSIVISSSGGQITVLALPLTAAVLLRASPSQMGLLTAMETVPFVLLSLPAGVWLDRVRKLPVYVGGELLLALVVASVPVAWWLGWLSMTWLYACGLLIGAVYTVAGSAAQIVLTQVVTRDRLVEAHAKNALATSGAEVAGPGLAGALIRVWGAPIALIVDAALLLGSAAMLRGVDIGRGIPPPRPAAGGVGAFLRDLATGVRFVRRHRLLVAMAMAVGVWQMCHHAAIVVQILFATRTLGLSEQAVGLSYTGMGLGTVAASLLGGRLSRRIGPGPCLVLIFINFLAMRQAVTPTPLLGRMTSTMRWLILLPAGPGALLGGWLGEHHGLRSALAFAGIGALTLGVLAWCSPNIRNVRALPQPPVADESTTADAVRSGPRAIDAV